MTGVNVQSVRVYDSAVMEACEKAESAMAEMQILIDKAAALGDQLKSMEDLAAQMFVNIDFFSNSKTFCTERNSGKLCSCLKER